MERVSVELAVCLLAAVPGMLALAAYAVLRWRGTLRVNADGWHAAGLGVGKTMLVPALRLFAVFQPLMRHEARLRRWAGGRRGKGREAVSDVVVELIPIG